MRTILITGNQGSGKTTLGSLLMSKDSAKLEDINPINFSASQMKNLINKLNQDGRCDRLIITSQMRRVDFVKHFQIKPNFYFNLNVI